MRITAELLYSFARRVERQEFSTLHRKNCRYRVAVIGSNLEFTPHNSRKPRKESWKSIEDVLTEATELESTYPKDYKSASRNLSYILSLRESLRKFTL